MSVLNENQLKRLADHKYSATCVSILDPYFQVWWRWLVEQMPLWVAPNLLTTLGLLCTVIPSFILVYYCPQAIGTAPSWAYFMSLIGMFLQQSLDAIDGKQARRTKTSSPMGELMDHGCDAVGMVVLCLAFAVTIELGKEPMWMFILCFTGLVLFYGAHWQTYVSGTLKFGLIDVTELQCSTMLIFLFTGLFGSSFWAYQVPGVGLSLKTCLIATSILGCVVSIISIVSDIYQGGMGKNGSTIAGTSVLSPLLPIFLTTYIAYYVATRSPSSIFTKNPCLFYLAHGFAGTKVTLKLVVACMTKSPLEIKDAVMLCGIIQILNIHYGCPIDEKFLLWAMMVYVVFNITHYSIAVCTQICNHLNIHCFKIPYNPKPAKKGD